MLVRFGVSRVRLTGGEPLLRRDCAELVRTLAALRDLTEVTATTNGELLADQALDLRQAGLARVNVHLDTLRPERFTELTGRSTHADVLRGIAAARHAGLLPIKVNVVLMKGINDAELLDFCRWAIDEQITVRFIELMDTGPSREFVRRRFLSGEDARDIIRSRHRLVPRFSLRGCSPAREYLLDDSKGVVGFIEAETKPFCNGCNRLRLTHDGRLSTCLFGGAPLHLARLLAGADGNVMQVEDSVRRFLTEKEISNPSVKGGHRERFSMADIGG
jgi:cyclic pyranopterin phosphate synthase